MTIARYIYNSIAYIVLVLSSVSDAEEGSMLKLPAPEMTGDKPLMQTLKERHSSREFSSRTLSKQVLANLLWVAAGVNRPATAKRTAPSARDWREVDVAASASMLGLSEQQRIILAQTVGYPAE